MQYMDSQLKERSFKNILMQQALLSFIFLTLI